MLKTTPVSPAYAEMWHYWKSGTLEEGQGLFVCWLDCSVTLGN